jgi:N-acetylmuramoyl-L-alanine amidase
MKINDHRLLNDDGTPVPFAPSPNMGGEVQHEYLVMHFTAGRSAEESIDWLTKEEAKASAHVVIGRDGSITQLVPFDRVAWHAGASSWEGLQGLNKYSLGIELDNAGRLTRQGNGWRA